MVELFVWMVQLRLVVSAMIGEFEMGKLLFGFEVVMSRWKLWDFICSVELSNEFGCLVSPHDF